ncbi:aldo/keto reductase [Streptomyces aquilus]|uniref:Aldo/keto reductase n=1 Tax=Streptomyces aquilus TaxID=2548456 RepID=A0A3Q9BUP2_9ACTN|nr:aldo/keto reductase [Streptomyces aquilus]AZP14874.1 aldo/keto reductase [Streptomyces aquilus]
MQNVTLSNGVKMPVLGFGVYQIPPEQTEQAVSEALAAGYRLLDTAAYYSNEEAVGRAIESSGIPRADLFVTTKLWVQDAPARENTRRAAEASLAKLGLDYLDLYLMHQPYGDVYGQWHAMEDLNREGLAKAIGVANFYPDRLVDLVVNNDITPAVNQIETHPFFQRTADQRLMRECGVQIQSWGGLAEGRLELFTHPLLNEIGKQHGKSVAQVVLRWLVQRSVVAIPKSVRPERMVENIAVFDFELTDDQMASIAALDTGASLFLDHHDPKIVAWLARKRLNRSGSDGCSGIPGSDGAGLLDN